MHKIIGKVSVWVFDGKVSISVRGPDKGDGWHSTETYHPTRSELKEIIDNLTELHDDDWNWQ